MPVFDSNLMFRTTGALTQSESSAGLKIFGTGLQGLAARVVIPSSAGTTTSILPRYYGSADNAAWNLIAAHPGGAHTILAGGNLELITPIVTNLKYVREELVVTGTTPNFGTVRSGLVTNVGFDWDRSIDFSS